MRDKKTVPVSNEIYIGCYGLGNGKSGKRNIAILCFGVVHFVLFCGMIYLDFCKIKDVINIAQKENSSYDKIL